MPVLLKIIIPAAGAVTAAALAVSSATTLSWIAPLNDATESVCAICSTTVWSPFAAELYNSIFVGILFASGAAEARNLIPPEAL